MKRYIVKLKSDDSLHIIGSSQFPASPDYAEVLEAPPDAQDAGDLDIVIETDELGTETRKVVVNESKKAERDAREAVKAQEREAKELERHTKKQAKRDELKAIDFTKLKTDEIGAMLKDLYERIGVIEGE